MLRPATSVALTVAKFWYSKGSQRASADSSLPCTALLCSTISTPPWVRLSCRLRQCDRVLGGVVRVQRTRVCNGHWHWIAMLLSLRASSSPSKGHSSSATGLGRAALLLPTHLLQLGQLLPLLLAIRHFCDHCWL